MTRKDELKSMKGQRRKPRMDPREQARQNAHGVAVGQVWVDNDRRYQANGWGPRRLQVFALTELHAECYLVDREGKFSAGEDKRYRNGKPRRIRLDRFRPTSTG